MNIQIKSVFIIFSLIFVVASIFFIIAIIELKDKTAELKNVVYYQNLMVLKADELRQSSDDLTRFARTYVITRNKEYKDNYYTILNIRNGLDKRPIHYTGVYWDLLEPIKTERHPLGVKESLTNEMKLLPYTNIEFELLKKSEFNSNILVNLEVEAFNAMLGIFKDSANQYSIKKSPDQTFAIQLLHSEQYHKEKQKIMLPIDEFLTVLSDRTEIKVQRLNYEVEVLFKNIYLLIIGGIILFLISLLVIGLKILMPIHHLTQQILVFKKGKANLKEKIFYDDEVGLMTKQFFAMKKKTDDDYEAIKKLALTDPLTNIKNRRAFFEIAKEILALSQRTKEIFSIIIFDIDSFKKINDTYGHTAGDEVLKHVVTVLYSRLRKSDILARFGGDEFIILLPNTDINSAKEIAEKIRIIVGEHPYNFSEEILIPISLSIGVTCNKNELSLKDLIEIADKSLYKAKNSGRNRVESA